MRPLALTLLMLTAVAEAQPLPSESPPAPAPEAPSASDVDIARAHFNTGQAYYEHGRFADAAREFEEAYRLSEKAPLLYNVGKSYDGGNDFARALDAYGRFLAAAPADNPDRAFAARRVELLHTLVGTLILDGAVPGSAVTLDGKAVGVTPLPAALELNPGRHQLELSHEGYATFRSAVDVPVGAAATVAARQIESVKVVTLAPAPRAEAPLYHRWWLWAAVGGAVVVAGVVTAVVATSSSSNSSLPTVQLPQVR